jgi:hypothetical protein
MYSIGIEIIHGISATLGVILTVPIVSAISAEVYTKKKQELIKLEEAELKKIEEIGKKELDLTNQKIAKQEALREQYIKAGKDIYEVDKNLAGLRQEASKYSTLANISIPKNTEDEIKKVTADLKALKKEQKEIGDLLLFGEASQKQFDEVKKDVTETEEKLKSLKKTSEVQMTFIPDSATENVDYLTQRISKLRDLGQDYSKEMKLLNEISEAQILALKSSIDNEITKSASKFVGFQEGLRELINQETTSAIQSLMVEATNLKLAQLAVTDFLKVAGKDLDEETIKILQESSNEFSEKWNILKSVIDKFQDVSKIETKTLIKPINPKEVESIYSILNARKDEALFLQKIEQYKKGIEGTTKGSLETAQLELSYAKQNLDEALKRKENEKDIAKFRRDYAEAELDVAKAQDAVTNKMLEQKAIASSFEVRKQMFSLGLDDRPEGKLAEIEDRVKSIKDDNTSFNTL